MEIHPIYNSDFEPNCVFNDFANKTKKIKAKYENTYSNLSLIEYHC
jgi:hypothetical protein